jgi:UDP-N-acetyl-D-mannosaminuronic acid dehydrogenase
VTASLYDSLLEPDAQRTQFGAGEIPVAVYGLGKMGLPLASVYAEHTGNVTGVDIDETVVERINVGDCHVQGEPGLPALVESLVADGSLTATTDAATAAADAVLHVVMVPTLIDDRNNPDLSAVKAAVDEIAAGLAPGDTVIFESTLPPRATTDVLRPQLAEESGLADDCFGVAVCPERTSSGRALADIRGTHPKVVGGVDDESGRVAELVYGELVDNDIVRVADATTAEAVKVFEGLYRDANIALANDLARLTDELGVDVRAAIDAANTQPYCDIHTPGPGVGGHCIPYYPYFVLNWLDGQPATLATARSVNDAMPRFVVDRVAEGLAVTRAASIADGGVSVADDRSDATPAPDEVLDGATVAVLGLTYRAGVEETRASPGIDICANLAARGASVLAADPLVDAEGLTATDVPAEELPDHAPDAVVLATAHEAFEALDWTALPPTVVVDGRDVLDLTGTDHRLYTVGRGWQ